MTLEHFAHLVSHDLKAPLNGIASMVDLVVDDYAERLDAEGRDQLRLIQTMAMRSVAMIDALRRLSRLATADLRRRPLVLTDVLTRVVREVAARHAAWHVDAAIAPLPDVEGDPALVPLLFDALVDNAVRFTDRGSRRVMIAPWSGGGETPEGHAAVAVADDGIGIPPRHRAVVFDMFKRLHPVEAYGGGVGAGLSLARLIVERHGGRIWIADDAVAGAGTTVVVTLPLHAGGPTPGGRPPS